MKTAACPECLAGIEIDDDFVECLNCGSISKLEPREPPTLVSLREADDAEGRAAAEDAFHRMAEKERIQYEAEMAKIIYREPGGERASVSEIDLSEPSLALRFLRLMDYLLVANCSSLLVEFLLTPIHDPAYRRAPALFAYLIIVTILSFALLTGCRHTGVIDERVWGAYLFALPLLILLYVLVIVGFLFIVTGVVESPVNLPPLLALYHALFTSFHLLLAAVGFVAVAQLRRVRVPLLDIPLGKVLAELRGRGEPIRDYSAAARRINKPRGTLIAGAGVVMILTGTLVYSATLSEPRAAAGGYLIFLCLQAAGWALLLRSRRYFQVEADSLLAVDRRRPILFLRSFDDDTRPANRDALWQLLDFSLEMRLSKHFRHFGPFIAVGSPREKVPVPGAARVALANKEWMPRVTNWIAEAGLIVMYAGRTNWVNWELAKIIETGRVVSLLLIIPEVGWRSPTDWARQLSRRFERLGEIFKGTRWSDSLAKLHDVRDVRAMLFRGDGSLVVMRSRPHHRDSHHLAANIAHYLMLEHAVTDESPAGAAAAQESLRAAGDPQPAAINRKSKIQNRKSFILCAHAQKPALVPRTAPPGE